MLVGSGFQVLFHSPPGVLFTFPSQYSALSVTRKYSALRGGPRSFPQGFPCPVVLRMPLHAPCLRLRGFHPLRHAFPGISAGFPHMRLCGSLPRRAMHAGLGSFPFARRYSGNRCFFLFLRLLRCFSSPGSPPHVMDWRTDACGLRMRVSPFRHLRISGYVPLPAAFRSLSRLSSAPGARASALCSFLLDLFFSLPSVASDFRDIRHPYGCPDGFPSFF